jgi:hypothetical protein
MEKKTGVRCATGVPDSCLRLTLIKKPGRSSHPKHRQNPPSCLRLSVFLSVNLKRPTVVS